MIKNERYQNYEIVTQRKLYDYLEITSDREEEKTRKEEKFHEELVKEQSDYLADTHTSVGINVCNAYMESTGDKTPVVVASTASPFKFSKAVLSAVEGAADYDDEFATVDALEKISSLNHNWNNVLRKRDGTNNMDTRQNHTDESLCV